MDNSDSNRGFAGHEAFRVHAESRPASAAPFNGRYATRPKTNLAFAAKLLLVDEDSEHAARVCDVLSTHRTEIHRENDGKRAAWRSQDEHFDAVLLNIGMPGADGTSILRCVRSRFSGPIIVISESEHESDEVQALEAGADDFISQPRRAFALVARLNKHLHRSLARCASEAQQVDVYGLHIDADNRTAHLRGNPVDLTAVEFDLLWYLASRAGQVLSRKRLYADLLGMKYDGSDRLIDLRVSHLRKKIGDDGADPKWLKAIRGVGYLFTTESFDGRSDRFC